MREAEVSDLLKQIDEDYKKKRDAIELVLEMLRGTKQGPITPTAIPPTKAIEPAIEPDTLESGLADAARTWIAQSTEPFSTSDLRDTLRGNGVKFEDASLRGLVKRLEARGQLVIVKRGVGRQPSVFRKKE